MDQDDRSIAALHATLAEKQATLADLEAKLPAHSARPHQIIEIEELEEEIDSLEGQLAELEAIE
jgi:uncharacterized protein Yka (UPF0111/DUF47 family)